MEQLPAPAGPALRRHERPLLAPRRRPAGLPARDIGTARCWSAASAGYWRGIFDGLRPDVALLSLGGRPNVDGEPFQGSSVDFMLEQVELLRPGRVAFCHHDPLFPGLPGVDIGPAAAALRVPGAAERLLRARVRHAGPAPRLSPTPASRPPASPIPRWRSTEAQRTPPDLHEDRASASAMSTSAACPVHVEQVAVGQHGERPDRLARIRARRPGPRAISSSTWAIDRADQPAEDAAPSVLRSGPVPTASSKACIRRPWSR